MYNSLSPVQQKPDYKFDWVCWLCGIVNDVRENQYLICKSFCVCIHSWIMEYTLVKVARQISDKFISMQIRLKQASSGERKKATTVPYHREPGSSQTDWVVVHWMVCDLACMPGQVITPLHYTQIAHEFKSEDADKHKQKWEQTCLPDGHVHNK